MHIPPSPNIVFQEFCRGLPGVWVNKPENGRALYGSEMGEKWDAAVCDFALLLLIKRRRLFATVRRLISKNLSID